MFAVFTGLLDAIPVDVYLGKWWNHFGYVSANFQVFGINFHIKYNILRRNLMIASLIEITGPVSHNANNLFYKEEFLSGIIEALQL